MDQNATIEAMLTRELSMADFTARLDTDEELEASLRNLVPPDALDNPSHLLWSQLSYSAMQESHFDCLELLDRLCRYDGSLGDNLNIFDFIRRIYCCRHPELTCTSFYQDAFDLYLDAVGDRFEGPEVQTLVEEIITGALAIQGKGKRVQYAKEKSGRHFM